MHNIAKLTMLLRRHAELPDGLSLAIEEFPEGWNVVQSGDADWLDKKVRRRRWHLHSINEGSPRSGVGKTSQEAIACALKLALRHLSPRFNMAKVEHIELKEYPWFFLAKVKVSSYQIQQSTVLNAMGEPASIPLPKEMMTNAYHRLAPVERTARSDSENHLLLERHS
jgi:hypothetical protein